MLHFVSGYHGHSCAFSLLWLLGRSLASLTLYSYYHQNAPYLRFCFISFLSRREHLLTCSDSVLLGSPCSSVFNKVSYLQVATSFIPFFASSLQMTTSALQCSPSCGLENSHEWRHLFLFPVGSWPYWWVTESISSQM